MFDTTENRLNYSELLEPSVGYELDFAVGLTYSLDLEALLGVPMAFGMLSDASEEVMKSPYFLLEAIRKSSDKITIFCNAGSISLPKDIKSVFSLLENSVFEIKLKNKANFHPKLWFIKYTSRDQNKSYIKLLILTRNLTFDKSIDMCVSLQGEIKKKEMGKNQPLVDMLNFVAKQAPANKRSHIKSLASDLMLVEKFDVSAPFEDYEFLPLGIGDQHTKEKTKLFETKRDILIVSPFLSDSTIHELTENCRRKTLVTRKSSITKDIFERFASNTDENTETKVQQGIYVVKDTLLHNEQNVSMDIHAKVYFTKTNEGNYLYIGSANASHNAFNKNIEFLLKLKYQKHKIGFDSFFCDFLNIHDNDENTPYEKVIQLPEINQNQKEEMEIDKAIKSAIYAIKKANIQKTNDTYCITITADIIPTGQKITIAPLMQSNTFKKFEEEIIFENLLLKELGEFYILCVEDKKVVIKIKTEGIPEERDNAIYQSIIDTKAKLFSYISLMLTEDYSEALQYFPEEFDKQHSGESKHSIQLTNSFMYENLLKVAHKNPHKLHEVDKLLARLENKNAKGEEVITTEFKKMYDVFNSIKPKKAKR